MATFKAQESDNLAQLANIRSKILNLSGLNLVQPTRKFIYEGDVDKVSTQGIINTRHLFLFNDLLIYGHVKHKGTLYEYSDHIFIKHLTLNDISFKSSSKIGFQLVRNDETKQRDYIMLCRTLEDKQKWVNHIQHAIEESKKPPVREDSPENQSPATKHRKAVAAASASSLVSESSVRALGRDREDADGFMKAAIGGNVEAMSQHLRSGGGYEVAAHDPSTGQTMLHKLAHAGHAPILHLLLESYAGDLQALVNWKDFSGATALHYAANRGQAECQQILLSYGANPALLDDDQASPLHYASRSGHLEALSQFLALPAATPIVFKKDSQGLTPAAYAAFHGHKEILATLLEHMRSTLAEASSGSPSLPPSPSSVRFAQATPSDDIDSSIGELLHLSSMNNHLECVEVVLDSLNKQENQKDTQRSAVNARDRQGFTAAHHAALNGHVAILSFLHQRGADIQAKDSTGGTILHAVCTGGSIECLKYLLDTRPDKSFIASTDSGGMSSLHRAVVAGHLCIVWELLNSKFVPEDIVNLKDNRGQTALHIASENKWGGCALLLINVGKADLSIRDEDGYMPLHVAMKHGAKEIVSYIANSEHEITKREGENLVRLGKQHADCVKIICQITGLHADKVQYMEQRSSSVSSFTSDLSEGSNLDTDVSDDDDDSSDDGESQSYHGEIKGRIAEIWHAVRSDQLLSNLFLETVRNLYRLPHDGDFGVTYWTYVNNFVQKVSQNPATDRGLLALRRDLNLDFLENQGRLGRNASSSFLDLRASGGDDADKATEKPLLQRTVATRKIPLGSSVSPRPPLFARSSSSLSSIAIPQNPQKSSPRSLSPSHSSLLVSSPVISQSPSSPQALQREASAGWTSPASRRSLVPSVSFGTLPSLSSNNVAASEEIISPKVTDKSFEKHARVNSEAKQQWKDERVQSIESFPDKPTERKIRSAKAQHSPIDKSSEPMRPAHNKPRDTSHHSPDDGATKHGNLSRPTVTLSDDSLSTLKKSASASQIEHADPNKHARTVGHDDKASSFASEDSKAKQHGPSEEWEIMWRDKRKSEPSFWESAVSATSTTAIDSVTSTASTVSTASSTSTTSPHFVGHQKENNRTNSNEPKVISPKLTESKSGDITAAIDELLADEEKSSPSSVLPASQPSDPLPTNAIQESRRATKRVVFLEKKREEQIAAVLHGHDITPRRIKQAIQAADCSVLIPGLLSALAPILPSKKEATICAEYHFPELETLSDLSDRELAQLFVVEMASTPRVHKRVEALMYRSGFELKASMIHKLLKSHFTVCSQLTSNYRLKDIVELLMMFATNLGSGSKKENDWHELIAKLGEAIPDFVAVIKPIIVNVNPAKDADILISWKELQYGVNVCKQEIPKCEASDPLISVITDFMAEATPELEQLQKEISVWEAIVDKIGVNLSILAPLLTPSPNNHAGEHGRAQENEAETGDPISILLSVLFQLVKKVQEIEEVDDRKTKKPDSSNRPKKGKKSKHYNPSSPFSRENLKGERILQPELTPLRVTFNAYKDFCSKTSKVKRKTYTFLKNQKG